jgi:hypothetical protein
LRTDKLYFPGLKCPAESGSQLRQEEERPAKQDYPSAYWAATSQAGDSLGGDRLKDRRSQVFVTSSIVQQRLEVCFGKHSATRSDWVQGGETGSQFIQAARVGAEQCGHLVDEGSGPASARSVHSLFDYRFEIGDLGVFSS